MKVSILNAALLLSLSQLSFSATTPKPSSCPPVPAIVAIGITHIEKNGGAWYAGVLSNNYSTKEKWTLTVGPINAANAHEAKQKAISSLPTLTYKQGPLANGQHWVCVYNNPLGYTTGTITPALGLLHSVLS